MHIYFTQVLSLVPRKHTWILVHFIFASEHPCAVRVTTLQWHSDMVLSALVSIFHIIFACTGVGMCVCVRTSSLRLWCRCFGTSIACQHSSTSCYASLFLSGFPWLSLSLCPSPPLLLSALSLSLSLRVSYLSLSLSLPLSAGFVFVYGAVFNVCAFVFRMVHMMENDMDEMAHERLTLDSASYNGKEFFKKIAK